MSTCKLLVVLSLAHVCYSLIMIYCYKSGTKHNLLFTHAFATVLLYNIDIQGKSLRLNTPLWGLIWFIIMKWTCSLNKNFCYGNAWYTSAHNINWRDVQRKNVVNNVDMSSLRAPYTLPLLTCSLPGNRGLCQTQMPPWCSRPEH